MDRRLRVAARVSLIVGLVAVEGTGIARFALPLAARHRDDVLVTSMPSSQSEAVEAPTGAKDIVMVAGTITFDEDASAPVFSPLTGRVAKIMARVGDRIGKGDAIALIESPDLGIAVSDVRKAQADLIAAEHDLRRKRDLFARLTIARVDLEVAEEERRRAFTQLGRAERKLKLLSITDLDTATDRYTLVAPIDGEIVTRSIAPGQEVEGQYAGGGDLPPLFTIGSLDRVSLLGDVLDVDLGRIRVGAAGRLVTTACPGVVTDGVVDWLSGEPDSETGTAKVRFTFPNASHLLAPNTYGEVYLGEHPPVE
jgi:cobalt-zinc-cadmium efflux system membrane fusion protein